MRKRIPITMLAVVSLALSGTVLAGHGDDRVHRGYDRDYGHQRSHYSRGYVVRRPHHRYSYPRHSSGHYGRAYNRHHHRHRHHVPPHYRHHRHHRGCGHYYPYGHYGAHFGVRIDDFWFGWSGY